MKRRTKGLALLAVLLWAALLVGGQAYLWRYKSTPGPQAAAPAAWPAGTSLVADATRPTLVFFVHPCCPCTRASTDELFALLPQAAGRVLTFVVALRPSVLPADWDERWLDELVDDELDVRLLHDIDGAEAARFGAQTSGLVMLYGAGGALRFSGGITAARGHAGANESLARLVSALQGELDGEPRPPEYAPVFGCGLSERTVGEDAP